MALSRSLDTLFSEELECVICLDRLRKPRVLKCLHSFCETCLQDYIDGGRIQANSLVCPECREKTPVPDVGVSGLKMDFRANKLLDALAETEKQKAKIQSLTMAHNCEVCGRQATNAPPLTYCKRCTKVMCEHCSVTHAGLPATKDHTVLSIAEALSGKVKLATEMRSVERCSQHDKKLKLFCRTCSEPICSHCTIIDHCKTNGHDYDFLKEITPVLRQQLTTLIEQVDNKTAEVDEFLADVNNLRRKVKDRREIVSEQIKKAADSIVEEVRKAEGELVAKNNMFMDEQIRELHIIQQNSEKVKTLGRNSTVLAKETMESDDIDIASMYTSLQVAMTKSLSQHTDKAALADISVATENIHLQKAVPLDPEQIMIGKLMCKMKIGQPISLNVNCTAGPKAITFIKDGRAAVAVNNSPTHDGHSPLVVKYIDSRYNESEQIFYDITYKSMQYITSLSTNQLVVEVSDGERAKNMLLRTELNGKILSDISQGLPKNCFITGLAADRDDNIYVADGNNMNNCVHVIRPDGTLVKSIPTAQPVFGIAISSGTSDKVAVITMFAHVILVRLLDQTGAVLQEFQKAKHFPISVVCDDHFVYVLWSGDSVRDKHLEKFALSGQLIETVVDKLERKYGTMGAPFLALSHDKRIAIISEKGKVLFVSPLEELHVDEHQNGEEPLAK